jgi:hypothetical protein
MELILVTVGIICTVASILIIKFPKNEIGLSLLNFFTGGSSIAYDEDIKKVKRMGKILLIIWLTALLAGLLWPCGIWGCVVPF